MSEHAKRLLEQALNTPEFMTQVRQAVLESPIVQAKDAEIATLRSEVSRLEAEVGRLTRERDDANEIIEDLRENNRLSHIAARDAAVTEEGNVLGVPRRAPPQPAFLCRCGRDTWRDGHQWEEGTFLRCLGCDHRLDGCKCDPVDLRRPAHTEEKCPRPHHLLLNGEKCPSCTGREAPRPAEEKCPGCGRQTAGIFCKACSGDEERRPGDSALCDERKIP